MSTSSTSLSFGAPRAFFSPPSRRRFTARNARDAHVKAPGGSPLHHDRTAPRLLGGERWRPPPLGSAGLEGRRSNITVHAASAEGEGGEGSSARSTLSALDSLLGVEQGDEEAGDDVGGFEIDEPAIIKVPLLRMTMPGMQSRRPNGGVAAALSEEGGAGEVYAAITVGGAGFPVLFPKCPNAFPFVQIHAFTPRLTPRDEID